MTSDKKYSAIPGLTIKRAGGGEAELFAVEGTSTLMGFQQLEHRETYGVMRFQYYIGRDFQIWHSRYDLQQNIRFVSVGDVPLLELHLPLTEGVMSWWDGQQQNRLRSWQFELAFTPHVNSETIFDAGRMCATLDVHYTPAFLQQFCDRYPALTDFVNLVLRGERASLLQHTVRFMHPQMVKAVQRILRYPGTIEFADQYYQEQVITLLEMVMQRATRMKPDYNSKKDIDASVVVRELIEKNPGHAYTTDELSGYTGINVSRLHKAFKELHGVTLFDFGQGTRLDYAKQLLLDSDQDIQDIALLCGYSEHAHFTHAFRKRFGFSPQHFRAIQIPSSKK